MDRGVSKVFTATQTAGGANHMLSPFHCSLFFLFHKASQAERKLPVVSPLPTSRNIYAATLVPYE